MNRLVILFCFIGLFTHAQVQEPKLVVGIVVDQMRFDYLNRYWNDFGEADLKIGKGRVQLYKYSF